jgi:hypothetical protein
MRGALQVAVPEERCAFKNVLHTRVESVILFDTL